MSDQQRTASIEWLELLDWLENPDADECVPKEDMHLRRAAADAIRRLDQRVHDQTHARIHAELAIEDALGKLDSGKHFDAYDVLERALNGRQQATPPEGGEG